MSSDDKKLLGDWLHNSPAKLRTSDQFKKILDKLPNFEGRVYRGSVLSKVRLGKLKEGETFVLNWNSSASKHTDIASIFISGPHWGEDVMFSINQKSGADFLRKYGGTQGESEVILKKGTAFRIDKVQPDFLLRVSGNTIPVVKVSLTEVKRGNR